MSATCHPDASTAFPPMPLPLPPLSRHEARAVAAFLRAWRAAAAKSGHQDLGYLRAACYQPRGYESLKAVRRTYGWDRLSLHELFARLSATANPPQSEVAA